MSSPGPVILTLRNRRGRTWNEHNACIRSFALLRMTGGQGCSFFNPLFASKAERFLMTLDSTLAEDYEPVIGLEVHCQLNTKSKLFCSCRTTFGALPNHQTCPVCLGLPGSLPVLNHKAVNLGISLALAVDGQVQEKSIFARKQYFY